MKREEGYSVVIRNATSHAHKNRRLDTNLALVFLLPINVLYAYYMYAFCNYR